MNFGKLFHRALSVALLSAAVTACAAGAPARAEIFRSPLGDFSLPVPSGLGMKTDEGHSEEGGRVSFHDDFGGLSAVTYWRLPPDRIQVLADPAGRDAAYTRTLHQHVMRTLFTPVSPQASVLHEEFLGEPGPDREYFAVVDLPGGSPLMNVTEGRRMDSVRSLLIFETNGFLYMLEQEIGEQPDGAYAFAGPRPSSVASGTRPDAAALESARDGLHAFRNTISFGSRSRGD
jgi:hypothetical protein